MLMEGGGGGGPFDLPPQTATLKMFMAALVVSHASFFKIIVEKNAY